MIPSPENVRTSHDFTGTFAIDSPESAIKEEYQDSPVIDTPESVIKEEYQDSPCCVDSLTSDQSILDTKYNMVDYDSSDSQDSDDSRLSNRLTSYQNGPRLIP